MIVILCLGLEAYLLEDNYEYIWKETACICCFRHSFMGDEWLDTCPEKERMISSVSDKVNDAQAGSKHANYLRVRLHRLITSKEHKVLWQVHCKVMGLRKLVKAERFPLPCPLPCVVWSSESCIWRGTAYKMEFQSRACIFCDWVNLHIQCLSEQLV